MNPFYKILSAVCLLIGLIVGLATNIWCGMLLVVGGCPLTCRYMTFIPANFESVQHLVLREPGFHRGNWLAGEERVASGVIGAAKFIQSKCETLDTSK